MRRRRGRHSRIDGCCSLEQPAAGWTGRFQLISVNSQLLAKDSQLAASSADSQVANNTAAQSDIKTHIHPHSSSFSRVSDCSRCKSQISGWLRTGGMAARACSTSSPSCTSDRHKVNSSSPKFTYLSPTCSFPENFSDVTFKLPDGSSVPGHRLILAIASPFFEAQFYGR